MSDLPNYLTVNQLISLAKAQGVTFGSAAPKVHLAYLSKLGLIPGAVKRKYNSEVVGHYPAETLTTLSEIQKMKEKGISYSDMKFFNKSNIPNPPISNQPNLNSHFSILNYTIPVLIFALGILFGYFLGLGKSNQNFKNLSLSANNEPIYIMTIDNQPKNLYKLGKISLDSYE